MRAHLIVRVLDGSIRELESFVATFAAEHGLSPDDQARTLIVLEELLTNLSRYGYPKNPEPLGEAEVTLELEGNQLTIEFGDDGQPFDPLTSEPPDFDQSVESRQVGGLGLHMVRELADEAHYSHRDGRNVVRLSRRVSILKRPQS
jgi:anti-sigma regulatory factor (Ser/Thr protein kinase)